MIQIRWYNLEPNYSHRLMETLETQIFKMVRSYKIIGYSEDDLAQEMRIYIYKKADKWDPRKSNFIQWANRVMKNRLIDLWRRTKRKNRDVLDAEVVPLISTEVLADEE